jgi:hypothetical protein
MNRIKGGEKMKKALRLVAIAAVILTLTGCSLFTSVTQTVDYVTAVKTYVERMLELINQAKAQTADGSFATDEQAQKDLIVTLEAIKQEISAFKALTPPKLLADLHQSMLDSSLSIEAAVDIYLEELRGESVDLNRIEQANDKLQQGLGKISTLLGDIQNLVK